jgi:hypothetical protein
MDGETAHPGDSQMSIHTVVALKSLYPIVVSGAIAASSLTAHAGAGPVIMETQKLIASDGMPSDKFGFAIDREGDTLIIGAPQHYTNSLPGSFYVFMQDEFGQWIEQQRVMSEFKPGEAEFGDLFGSAVALEGDTLLVGAPFVELNAMMVVGSVYVFKRDATGQWIKQQTILPVDDDVLRFGQDISMSGNVAVIGSYDRAFVFERDDAGVWSLKAELPNLELDFVGPVSFDASLGTGTIAVAVGSFSQGEHRAHLFSDAGGSGWELTATIIPPPALFGSIADVCLDGDRLALGVPDATGPDRAFVYQDAGSDSWSQQAMFDPNSLENDSFGMDTVLKGNLLLVGANHAGSHGITYLFKCNSAGEWLEQAQLMPSDTFAHNFGDEIHFQDSVPVIGSWAHHENGLYAGAAYVFEPISIPNPADITGDDLVNVDDLLALINGWGVCATPPQTCSADVAPEPTGDGVVNVDDLMMVINNWS